jgi:hypothetical protein
MPPTEPFVVIRATDRDAAAEYYPNLLTKKAASLDTEDHERHRLHMPDFVHAFAETASAWQAASPHPSRPREVAERPSGRCATANARASEC